MINFDDYPNENKTEHNLKLPYIPDHPYRILIIGGPGSGKTNALLDLINKQPDIDKIYLYTKDSYEAKYQFLINKRESTGLKHLNDPKAFIEYSNDMQDVYKNIEEYNPGKKGKTLIVFDDMIIDMIDNKKLNFVVTKLFIRGRKSQRFSCFYYSIIYFKFPKDVILNSMYFYLSWKFLVKVNFSNNNKKNKIAVNHSSDIDLKDFTKINKDCIAKPYSFLVVDRTLLSDNPL